MPLLPVPNLHLGQIRETAEHQSQNKAKVSDLNHPIFYPRGELNRRPASTSSVKGWPLSLSSGCCGKAFHVALFTWESAHLRESRNSTHKTLKAAGQS